MTITRGAAEAARAVAVLPDDDDPDTRLVVENGSGGSPLTSWLIDLLEPTPLVWSDAAEDFWQVAGSLPGAPSALNVVCVDTGEELHLGDPSGGSYAIHGAANELCSVFSGEMLLIDAAFLGRVKIDGTLPEMSVLTGACMDIHTGAAR